MSSRRVEPQEGAELKMAGWEWEEEREEKERAVTRLSLPVVENREFTFIITF